MRGADAFSAIGGMMQEVFQRSQTRIPESMSNFECQMTNAAEPWRIVLFPPFIIHHSSFTIYLLLGCVVG